MSNIRPLTGQSIIPAGGSSAVIDRFEQVFAVAKPTLDVAVKLRDARTWLADRQRYPRVMIPLDRIVEEDEDGAKARLAIIPEMAFLQEAARLFDGATPAEDAQLLALLESKMDRPSIARKLKRTVSAIAKRRDILNKRGLVEPGLKAKGK